MASAKVASCAAVAALSLVALAGQARAADKSWNVAGGIFSNPANWLVPGVPGPNDNVFIGNTVAARNAFLTLDVHNLVNSVTITDGMVLNTHLSRLVVSADTLITGQNQDNNIIYPSRIQVRNGPTFQYDYVTRNLTATQGAEVELIDGGGLQVNGTLTVDSDSDIWGEGEINLAGNSAVAMRLEGYLQPTGTGMTIRQTGTGRIDLDGVNLDDAMINITSSNTIDQTHAQLTIIGDELYDTYDEGFWIGDGNKLTMNIFNGWSMGIASRLWLTGTASEPSRVDGSSLRFYGLLQMPSSNARGIFDSDVQFQPGCDVEIGAGDRLTASSTCYVYGGTFTITGDGVLDMSGATLLGGTFNSDSGLNGQPVRINGSTIYDGTVTFNCSAVQNGSVVQNGPSTINAMTFDMDGSNGQTHWEFWRSVTVNAQQIDYGSSIFDGLMDFYGSSKLTINLPNPSTSWRMNGNMNLRGPVDIPLLRLDGNPMNITGDVTVDGQIGSEAAMTFAAASQLSWITPQSLLAVSDDLHIDAGATFTGAGSLRCSNGHNLFLADNVNIGQTWLINDGEMQIAAGAGEAHVGRFNQIAGRTWHVDIGGNNPGFSHDHLTVTSLGAQIDGSVDVDLINGFVPVIGQTFEILIARAGVTGTFSGAPSTVTPNGLLVEWSYVYTPTQVLLRCESITARCPADFNVDGVVDFFDYLDFVDAFAQNLPNADFNHDGVIDFFDYLDFVDAFSTGC